MEQDFRVDHLLSLGFKTRFGNVIVTVPSTLANFEQILLVMQDVNEILIVQKRDAMKKEAEEKAKLEAEKLKEEDIVKVEEIADTPEQPEVVDANQEEVVDNISVQD